jgi:hypothetical protein
MDENGYEEFGGILASDAENLKEACRDFAEKTMISAEEAAYIISAAMYELKDRLEAIFGGVEEQFQEIEESAEWLNVEPRARRRKKHRARARFIEQRYRAEIRRAEGERLFRRVYKPP